MNNNILNNETQELRDEIRTLEILTTLFILFGEFPKKPNCIKYYLDKYGFLKWFIVIIFLYNKKYPLKILIIIIILYNLLYLLDELYFNQYIIINNNTKSRCKLNYSI